jgi:hypothetical protein
VKYKISSTIGMVAACHHNRTYSIDNRFSEQWTSIVSMKVIWQPMYVDIGSPAIASLAVENSIQLP